MATAPNVQNDAATTRRYSSIPAPMYFGDRVRKPARADSQISDEDRRVGRFVVAHRHRRRLDVLPNRTYCASSTAAQTTNGVRDPKIIGVSPFPARTAEQLLVRLRHGSDDGELSAPQGRFGYWDSSQWTGALLNDHGLTPRPGYERTHRWNRRSQRGVRRLRRSSNRAMSGRRAESVMAVATKVTCKDALFDLARVPSLSV